MKSGKSSCYYTYSISSVDLAAQSPTLQVLKFQIKSLLTQSLYQDINYKHRPYVPYFFLTNFELLYLSAFIINDEMH